MKTACSFNQVLFILLLLNVSSFLMAQTRENLGNKVNSNHKDFAPVITPDGQTLYFIREIGEDQEIYFSELQLDGTWGEAQAMGFPLNNSYPNAVKSALPDGNTLLVHGYYVEGQNIPIKKGYSLVERTRFGWSYPRGIDIKHLDFIFGKPEFSARMSEDGTHLLLSFYDRKGNSDLYVSHLQSNGNWSSPKSLGNVINTSGFEAAPFLAADGKTLYFASDRPGGFGDADIYVSKREDDSWKKWSEPKNLGEPYNTEKRDVYFVIPATGDYAYLSSETESQGLDLFRIALKEVVKPEPVVLVRGRVYDAETKQPLGTSIHYELLSEGKAAGIAHSSPSDGEYKIVLPRGARYGFRAELEGYYAISENLDVSDLKAFHEIRKDLYLAPIQENEVFTLNNVFFNYAQTTLRKESYPELNRLAKFLNEQANLNIELAGYTDSLGADEKNLELSQARAQACADYLISQGIDTKRIIAKGYGENDPIAPNNTLEGRQKNRRVEFTILSEEIGEVNSYTIRKRRKITSPSDTLNGLEESEEYVPVNHQPLNGNEKAFLEAKVYHALGLTAQEEGFKKVAKKVLIEEQKIEGETLHIQGIAPGLLSKKTTFRGKVSLRDGKIVSLEFKDPKESSWVAAQQAAIQAANGG